MVFRSGIAGSVPYFQSNPCRKPFLLKGFCWNFFARSFVVESLLRFRRQNPNFTYFFFLQDSASATGGAAADSGGHSLCGTGIAWGVGGGGGDVLGDTADEESGFGGVGGGFRRGGGWPDAQYGSVPENRGGDRAAEGGQWHPPLRPAGGLAHWDLQSHQPHDPLPRQGRRHRGHPGFILDLPLRSCF